MIELRPIASPNERDFRIIFSLLVLQHHEVGRGVLNPGKTGEHVYLTIAEGAAYIVERDGEPIGTVGLTVNDLWYSDQQYYQEHWLYLAPHERDGEAFRAVLAELQFLANVTGLPVQATVFNERRFKKQSSISRIAEHFMFVPAGTDVLIQPQAEESDDERRQHQTDDRQHAAN
jgi:hypothetical protein